MEFPGPSFMADPYPVLAEWRRTAPIKWIDAHQAWFLTRYDGVRDALLDDERLSNDVMRPYIRHASRADHELHYLWSCLGIWLTFIDPPEHKRLRGIVNRAYLPGALEYLRPTIARQVDVLLKDMMAKGDAADFVRDFAYILPAVTIGAMLGIPPNDLPRITSWSDRLARFIFISTQESGLSRYSGAVEALQEMRTYFTQLVEDRRKIKGNLVIDNLISAQDGDARLTDQEVAALCMLLIFAGHETTTMYLTNSLRALFGHPEQRSMLLDRRNESDFVRNAIRELLRWDSACLTLLRYPVTDVDICGQRIPAGTRIYLAVASANRDERVFVDADRLNLERDEARKVITLGQGIHNCLGTHLVYLESEIALPIVIERLRDWELSPQPLEFTDMLAFRSTKNLPIRPRH